MQQRIKEQEQAIKEYVPQWHTQPVEELLAVGSSNSTVVNDIDFASDKIFWTWLENLPPEQINFFLPSFSTGSCPRQAPLSAICSNQFTSNALDKAKALLEKGADVNLRRLDIYQDTPLLSAVGHSWPLCEFLLFHGADITAVDNRGYGVFARACVEVAHQLDLFEQVPLSLFRLAAQSIIRQCEANKTPLTSITNVPEEVQMKLRMEVAECASSVFGWVSLMPPEKERLQLSFLDTVRSTVTPSLELASRDSGNCGKQDVIRTAFVGDHETVNLKYHQSGNSRVANIWTLTFPKSNQETTFKIGQWGNVAVNGIEHVVEFAKEVMGAEDDQDALVCIIFFFGLSRNFYNWSQRHHCLFPTELGFAHKENSVRSSLGELPAWYIACGRKWMHLPLQDEAKV